MKLKKILDKFRLNLYAFTKRNETKRNEHTLRSKKRGGYAA